MNKMKNFDEGLKKILEYKYSQNVFKGWFLYQEIKMEVREELVSRGLNPDAAENQAEILNLCVERMPLSIPEGSFIAGTQDDAFSPSYALINPSFKVETFAGYCDPVAVYNDILPDDEISAERITKVRNYYASTIYAKALGEIYKGTGLITKEVAFFVEPVTGHVIPDCRPILKYGIKHITTELAHHHGYSRVMRDSLKAVITLAGRYADLAETLCETRKDNPGEVARLKMIAENCRKVPELGSFTLHEAVQSFALLWQVMCLEQAPNPYAFSVGNLDRVFQPYLKDTLEEEAVLLIRHLLAFFMVGARCWAISQNVLVGGKDYEGNDLTNDMSYIVLEAFYQSNSPQPALSARLHSGSPDKFYNSMGRFFFTHGHSTPSLFNDDAIFKVLEAKGIECCDMKDYAIAGCQEPLIMGKENGNTTNSWLNLAKILELTLNDGKSLISGKKIGLSWKNMGYNGFEEVVLELENAFMRQLDSMLDKMEDAANKCTASLSRVAVPFCSVLLGCLENGRDMRDIDTPGTKYSGSGCLIHGLSVLTDSLVAAKSYLEHKIDSPEKLLEALKHDFKGFEEIRVFLSAQPKYGNNQSNPDAIAGKLAEIISKKVNALRNPAGKPFLPDYSTPSTHLLYGYWVGATPDGRNARTMLGYGIDPRPGISRSIPDRMLSNRQLPYLSFSGGYASHIGISPDHFVGAGTMDAKTAILRENIIEPLFCVKQGASNAPFYVYFNIDKSSHLRKVLANPKEYAPEGIYIMRIHGTFVNFLDLSPAIQQDIIERLDEACDF
ncbi:MAG: pyruvate formate lyase family protein [Victivallaceae bacterium]